MNKIGEKIKENRIKEGLTQKQLGDILYVTDKTISSWEICRTYPDIDMLKKISKALNLSMFELVYDNANENEVEIEVKIKVDENEYKRIKELIEKEGNYISKMNQKATYYEPSDRSFTNSDPIRKWLRIRKEGNKKILNYKYCNDNRYCCEYEVGIDNDNALMKIFDAIGLIKIAKVSKRRTQYMYEDKYEFSFDKVDNLGYFVEIEVKKPELSLEEEYEKLIELINKFNIDISKITTKRYPYYFIKS